MGAFLGYTVPHHGGDAFDDEIEDEPTRVVRRMELVGNHTMIVDDGVELVDVRGVMPGHHDALPVPSPVSSNDRGWGPSGGPVELKTTFWERGGDKDAEEDGEVTRAIETHTIEPSEREIITSSQVRARRPRRGRAAIIAGLCGAAGVILGSAVGLAANLDPEPPPTLTVPTVVAAPPAPAPEGIVEPATEVIAAPEPVAAVVAPVVVAEPTPAVAPEAVEATAPEVTAPEPTAPEITESAEDLLALASDAVRDADVELATDALDRARGLGADGLAADRLDAALAVLRGEGAPAVPRLRAFAESHRDASLWTALGRVLEQAERDPEAEQAFARAVLLDPSDPHAHIGLASIDARAADISAAQRHLRSAEEAVQGADADPIVRARVRVAAGLILLERGRFGEAIEEATQARVLDGRSAEASLLLARIALARGQDPEAHLRAAVAGRAPAPVALGLLAPRLRGAEACELAGSYLERAPEGWDARAMRRITRRC